LFVCLSSCFFPVLPLLPLCTSSLFCSYAKTHAPSQMSMASLDYRHLWLTLCNPLSLLGSKSVITDRPTFK
jgi:hypothetical protein